MSNYVSLGIFIAIIVLVWIVDGKKFKKEGFLFYLRRTKWGVDGIHSIGSRYSSLLKRFGTLGVIFAFGLVGLLYYFKTIGKEKKISRGKCALITVLYTVFASGFIYLLHDMLFASIVKQFDLMFFGGALIYVLEILAFLFGMAGYTMFSLSYGVVSVFAGSTTESSVQLVLPVEVSESSNLPIVSVPLVVWLVSIFIILTVHELAHAFVSSSVGLKVKSIGYGFFAILPIGFVEPDEVKISKVGSLDRSRIYSAGAFNNVISAIIIAVILISTVFVSAKVIDNRYGEIYDYNGVGYSVLPPEDSVELPSSVLPESGVIIGLNGEKIDRFDDFIGVLENVGPDENLSILINDTSYDITTVVNPQNSSRGFIGINGFYNSMELKDEFKGSLLVQFIEAEAYIVYLFSWVVLLSIGIGLVNLLPIRGLDGGKMLEEISITFFGKKIGVKIVSYVSLFALLVILFSIFGSYIV